MSEDTLKKLKGENQKVDISNLKNHKDYGTLKKCSITLVRTPIKEIKDGKHVMADDTMDTKTTKPGPKRVKRQLNVDTVEKSKNKTGGTAEKVSKSYCVVCSIKFESQGFHYSSGSGILPIGVMKKMFCKMFSTWEILNRASSLDKNVSEKFLNERYPFCPQCFVLVNDLCRREEQLRACMKNYIETKDLIVQNSVKGHNISKGHPHYLFQQRILLSALQSNVDSLNDIFKIVPKTHPDSIKFEDTKPDIILADDAQINTKYNCDSKDSDLPTGASPAPVIFKKTKTTKYNCDSKDSDLPPVASSTPVIFKKAKTTCDSKDSDLPTGASSTPVIFKNAKTTKYNCDSKDSDLPPGASPTPVIFKKAKTTKYNSDSNDSDSDLPPGASLNQPFKSLLSNNSNSIVQTPTSSSKAPRNCVPFKENDFKMRKRKKK